MVFYIAPLLFIHNNINNNNFGLAYVKKYLTYKWYGFEGAGLA